MNIPDSRLASLLQRPDLWRGDMLAHPLREEVKSGFAELDAVLPGGGWPRGVLTELLSDGEGMGEVSLLLPALVALEAETGWIALVAPPWQPHAPAWQEVGTGLSRLLVVRAEPRDAAWACEQLLASGACAAVLAWLPQIDARALRRLQLAGAGRRSLAFVFRPAAMAASASPASLRLSLAAGTTGLAVHIIKRRGSPLARGLSLAVARPVAWTRLGANDQTGVRASARLARLVLS
jgi:cell division inhibitor SulA